MAVLPRFQQATVIAACSRSHNSLCCSFLAKAKDTLALAAPQRGPPASVYPPEALLVALKAESSLHVTPTGNQASVVTFVTVLSDVPGSTQWWE